MKKTSYSHSKKSLFGAFASAFLIVSMALLPAASVPFVHAATQVTITSSAGAHGTISPSGTNSFDVGSNQTFITTPDSGYTLSNLTIDGADFDFASYTFTDLQTDHTISATFIPLDSASSSPTDPGAVTVSRVGTSTPAVFNATWGASTDNIAVAGYSYVFDQEEGTIPDDTIDTQDTAASSSSLDDGVWVFHVKAIDDGGNTSGTVSSNDFRVDTIKPVITLIGNANVNVTLGDTYTDAGATANDNVDGTIRVTTTGDVDTSTIGDYTITYTVSDMSGNDATPVTRTVHVVSSGGGSGDITLPVGPTTVTSDTHVAGVTSSSSAVSVSWDVATDDTAVSGYSYIWDHSSSTIPNSSVDVASTSLTTSLADGTWYFHVVSVDSSANISSPSITFGPVIIDTAVSGGGDTSAPTDPGAVTISRVGTSTPATFSATWGASTDNVGVIGYSFVFDQNASTTPDATVDTTDTTASSTLSDGAYFFHVLAVDAAGNVSGTIESSSFRVDTVAPVITLVGSANVNVTLGDTYTDAGATGLDDIDGTINVTSVGTVDTSTLGDYTITYTLSDLSGNEATPVTRTVHVVSSGGGGPDTTAPTAPGMITYTRIGTSTPALAMLSWVPSTDNVGVAGYSYVIDWSDDTIPDTTIDATSSSFQTTLDDLAYVLHVRAIDAAGNASAVTSADFRVDTVIPVVTLTGNPDVSVTLGSVYVDDGATAVDDIDGRINGNIVTTGTVDTSTLGDYTLTYVAHDESGNLSLPVTRTVHVVAEGTGDINAPSIPSSFSFSRIGSSVPALMRITWASSTDNVAVAGYSYVIDQTPGTIPDGTVDTASTHADATLADGAWEIHIYAVDTSGNLSALQQASFRVDTVPPVITLVGNSDITITQGTAYNDQGATALDSVDGSIHVTSTGVVDTSIVGTYTITYTVSDEHGNQATPVTRTIHVVSGGGGGGGDTTLPLGPTSVTSDTHIAGVSSTSSIVTVLWNAATDNVGVAGYSYVWDSSSTTIPNTSSDVTATSLTTSLNNGTWYFHVRSIDTSGNASSPAITFGPVIISAASGTSSDTTNPSDPTSVAVARIGTSVPGLFRATWGTSTDNVALLGYSYVFDQNASTIPDGTVDTPSTHADATLADGAYFFHIKAIDTSGNTSGTVHTASFRVDTVPPVITLNGTSHVFVHVGDTYTDAGATAIDSVDGSLSVTATGTINTSVVGDYVILYTVSDTHGNNAIPVIRTVHVTESGSGGGSTLPPTIVTLGSNPVTVTQGSVYVDLGAVANDAVDGSISSQIVTTGAVNTNIVGTYILTYSIENSAHLTATSTRTVHVVGPPLSQFFTIAASAGPNGIISPNGASTILQGFNQTYTIMPNVGYIIQSLVVDGMPQVASSSFTFANIQANHTISASFGTTTPSSSYLPPIANFRASIDALTVMFIDMTENLNGTSTASSPYTYAWNFGDNATTIASTVGLGGHNQIHYYAQAGTYPVTLTIADQFGNVSTSTKTVTVSSPSIGSTGNSGVTISYGGGGFVYAPIPLNANTLINLNNPEATSSIVITDIHFLPAAAIPIAIVRNFTTALTKNLKASTKIVPLKGKSTTVIKSASSTSATTSASVLSKIENITFGQNLSATASVQAAAVKEKTVSIGARLKNLISKLLGR